MTDWEDASHDELMARLDAAMERLEIEASVEAALYFEGLADEAPTFTWPPAPNTAHPSLERQARWVRDWINAGNYNVVLPGPPPPLKRLLAQPMDVVEPELPKKIILTITKAWGLGVHVGDPYVWMWKAAVDENGRWICTDSWPEYHPDEPWRHR
jgi:hypothetical protein